MTSAAASKAPRAPGGGVIGADRLHGALQVLAGIIDRRGDKGVIFLPIFDRLETALASETSARSRLAEIKMRYLSDQTR